MVNKKPIVGYIEDKTSDIFIPTDSLSECDKLKIKDAINTDIESEKRLTSYDTLEFNTKFNQFALIPKKLFRLEKKEDKEGFIAPIGLIGNINKLLSKNADMKLEITDNRKDYSAEPFTPKYDPRDYQKPIIESAIKNQNGLIVMGTGSGKAQPLDAKLLTPHGWTTMGKIQSGDEIIGIDGLPHYVLEIYPQGMKDVYKITFQDGSWTECCKDHLWSVQTKKQKYRNTGYKVKSIKELLQDGLHDTNGDRKWQIPITQPIQFQEQQLPLDPYIMGCLLGNGCLTTPNIRFTSMDEIVLAQIDKLLPTPCRLVHLNNYDYAIQIPIENTGIYGCNPVLQIIRDIGLRHYSEDKFIPEIYKFSSIEQRIAILQGLLDTDGYAGHCEIEYSSSSEQLADDVIFLVQSLGGKATKSSRIPYYTYKDEKKEGLRNYRIIINLGNMIIPFRSKSKLQQYHQPTKYFPCRIIDSIELIGKKECQCIYTDAPDHLYLTDFCIATHNTVVAGHIIGKLGQDALFIVPNTSLLFSTANDIKDLTEKLPNVHVGQIGGGKLELQDHTNQVDINVITLPIATRVFNNKKVNPEVKNAVQRVNKMSNIIIVDEAQSISTEGSKAVVHASPAKYRFGLTATPYTKNELDLTSAFGEEISNLKAKKLVDIGELVKPEIYRIDDSDINPKNDTELLGILQSNYCAIPSKTAMHKQVFGSKAIPSKKNKFRVQYIRKGLLECNQKRNDRIGDVIERLYSNEKTTLVFVNSDEHGRKLISELQKRNVDATLFTGKSEDEIILTPEEIAKNIGTTKKREAIFNRVKQGKVRVVITTPKLMGAGVSIKGIDSIVYADVGQSKVDAVQTVGRAMRTDKAKGKTEALIFDFVNDGYPNAEYTDHWGNERKKAWRDEEYHIIDITSNDLDKIIPKHKGISKFPTFR